MNKREPGKELVTVESHLAEVINQTPEAIQHVKTYKLKSNPGNPRLIRNDKFEKLVASIREFPQMMLLRPIIVNEDFMVLGGNMRLKACQHVGLKSVPVLIAKGLTPDQQDEFIIKDNVGFGEWDYDILNNEWDTNKLEHWALEIEPIEIEEPDASEDGYEVPDGGLATDIELGDIFQIGPHKLLCGSSTDQKDWQKLFQDKKADMVLTDPPYNVDYEGTAGKIMNDKMQNDAFYRFLLDAFTAAFQYTKEGGAWYVCHADSEGFNFRSAFQDSGMLMKQCLVWVKNALVMGRQDYQWKHEPILYGWKPGAAHYFINDRTNTTTIEQEPIDVNKLTKKELLKLFKEANSTSVIRCDKPRKNDMHPTMKPILLMAPLIKNSSRIGDIVADGFAGSGSTMVAAHQMKRIAYCIELDPKFCEVIIDRMQAHDPTIKITKNGIPY